jgi:cytidylate kinase
LTRRDPTEFTLEHATAFDAPPDYGDLLQEAIRETAADGEVVIVAHAAAAALAGTDGVLRLFVTASPETRAARVSAGEGLSEAEAMEAIEESDAARRSYFHRFYGFEETPTVYDLVANTDVLDEEQVAEVVVGLVRGGAPAVEREA